ncbi:MAG: AAA family ATPase [Bacteroidia bacterium]|nr:AAA family ATPase [Bacteroidia bacterium]
MKSLSGLLCFLTFSTLFAQNPDYQLLNQMFQDQVLRVVNFDSEKFGVIPPVLQEELMLVADSMAKGHAHCLFVGVAYNTKDQAMAAAWVGSRLKRKVYHLKLQSTVSRYIGETEKNLSRLFELAERGKWILFFDEADALFGKRTEGGENAANKYANLETSYLLQLIREHQVPVFMRVNRFYPELKPTFRYQIVFD